MTGSRGQRPDPHSWAMGAYVHPSLANLELLSDGLTRKEIACHKEH